MSNGNMKRLSEAESARSLARPCARGRAQPIPCDLTKIRAPRSLRVGMIVCNRLRKSCLTVKLQETAMKNLVLAAALFISPLIISAAPAEMTVHIINVGQANAALLEFPCGAILIDASSQHPNDSQILVDYLTRTF